MKTTHVTITSLFVVLAACGGHRSKDTYARGTDLQRACCENLSAGARDKCLGDLVRIEDRAVQSSSANQQTYACVVEHFTCDPASGHATQPSAQAQLECIQEL